VSRVAPAITSREQRDAATEFRRLLAAYREAKDLIEIGAYVPGSNPLVDQAVGLRPAMDRFLQQDIHEITAAETAWAGLQIIVS